MKKSDIVICIYKPKRVSRFQTVYEYDLSFKQFENKVFESFEGNCKSCPNFTIDPHKTVWGSCRIRCGSKKTKDKNYCHPHYREQVRFHCSQCGREGRFKSFLIEGIMSHKFFRIYLCSKCIKKFRFYIIKSFWRYFRHLYDSYYNKIDFNIHDLYGRELMSLKKFKELIK